MTVRIRILEGVDGELATPELLGPAPGLVVCHEWHGLNEHIKALCERLGKEGFVALAPDLYHGEVATDDARATELMQSLSTSGAMDDIAAAVATLKASPQSNGKVGVIGFCMGGAMTFAAAVSVLGIDCAVPFYGIPIDAYWDAEKMRVPIQAHFASRDGWAKPERARELADAVTARGGQMELFVYEAGHAFMREGDPSAYDEASATLAWSRAIAFLKQHLAVSEPAAEAAASE
jgi:carboxymethylenebutenolidase